MARGPDVDEENGTLVVLPGLHKQGTLALEETGSAFGGDRGAAPIARSSLPADLDGASRAYSMRAGEAALHHVMLPHTSGGNPSPVRWRRAIAIRFARASAAFGPKDYSDPRTTPPEPYPWEGLYLGTDGSGGQRAWHAPQPHGRRRAVPRRRRVRDDGPGRRWPPDQAACRRLTACCGGRWGSGMFE